MELLKLLNGKKTAIAAGLLTIITLLNQFGVKIQVDADTVNGIVGGVFTIGSTALAVIGLIHKAIKAFKASK